MVDINNDSDILYAAVQLINVLIEKNILIPKIFPLLEPIHGKYIFKVYHNSAQWNIEK